MSYKKKMRELDEKYYHYILILESAIEDLNRGFRPSLVDYITNLRIQMSDINHELCTEDYEKDEAMQLWGTYYQIKDELDDRVESEIRRL